MGMSRGRAPAWNAPDPNREGKGGVILKRVIAVMVLAALLVGCGPSQRERQAGWMRALQMELDAAHDQWEAAVASQRFSTNAGAMGDLKARYEQVYARWAMYVDPLSQGLLSYAVALASRVDRGTIPRDEANRLYDTLRAEIDVGRRTFSGEETSGQREAAMLQWWERFWSTNQQSYRATPGNPIHCSVIPGDTGGNTVKCE
jgi:hypothetical protein